LNRNHVPSAFERQIENQILLLAQPNGAGLRSLVEQELGGAMLSSDVERFSLAFIPIRQLQTVDLIIAGLEFAITIFVIIVNNENRPDVFSAPVWTHLYFGKGQPVSESPAGY
jgi:hypothetical protein